MQRKATKNTRGPNAAEKAFQGWLKEQPCCWCNNPGPSIVDHVRGATFKHNKVLIGHWLVAPNCTTCDERKTIGGEKLGDYAAKWHELAMKYEVERMLCIPDQVIESILDWGTTWQNG